MGQRGDNFSFIAVEFEEDVVHPGFDVRETVAESGWDGRSNGCGGDVVGIVGVTVKLKTMAADDVT